MPFGFFGLASSWACTLPNMSIAPGKRKPLGALPTWLWKNWLPHEVEIPLAGAPGHETPGKMSPSAPPPFVSASGTANSIAPSRQLSKIQLSWTRASFMPA